MNYRRHVEEAESLGVSPSEQQRWFNKQTTCLTGPFDCIDPGVTEKLDYEVELGVVIGRKVKGVQEERALDHVFGYLVANDVSARDWQFHSPTVTMGKSFDTHGPIGPWIVTASEIPDPQNLGLLCLVNGGVRQDARTSEMIFSLAEQITYLSTAFTRTRRPDRDGNARGSRRRYETAPLPQSRRCRPLRSREDRGD